MSLGDRNDDCGLSDLASPRVLLDQVSQRLLELFTGLQDLIVDSINVSLNQLHFAQLFCTRRAVFDVWQVFEIRPVDGQNQRTACQFVDGDQIHRRYVWGCGECVLKSVFWLVIMSLVACIPVSLTGRG